MKLLYLILVLWLFSNTLYADEIEVVTEYGYFIETSTGHIVSKARLPKGKHPIQEGYEYYEVEDKTALDAIEVWQKPIIPLPTFEEKLLEALKENENVKKEIENISSKVEP